MRQIILTLTTFIHIAMTMTGFSDYISDRLAAERMINKGKLEKACAMFTKMVNDSATSLRQKEDALEEACLLAIRMRRFDQAENLAATISNPVTSKVCRLKILNAQGSWKQFVDQCKDEDLSAWPEAYIDIGYYQRGLAQSRLGDFQSAEQDLKKAIETAVDDGQSQAVSALELANVHIVTKGDDKALKTYLTAQILSRETVLHIYYQTILARAKLLTKQKKYDEVSRELANIDLSKLLDRPTWHFRFLRAYGDLRSAKGKPEEAQRYYDEALMITNALPSETANLKKQLKK